MKNELYPLSSEVLTSLNDFGNAIREARIKRAITAQQLAKDIGISRRTLTAIESGAPSVSIGNYLSILEFMKIHISFSDLIDASSETFSKTELSEEDENDFHITKRRVSKSKALDRNPRKCSSDRMTHPWWS